MGNFAEDSMVEESRAELINAWAGLDPQPEESFSVSSFIFNGWMSLCCGFINYYDLFVFFLAGTRKKVLNGELYGSVLILATLFDQLQENSPE